MATTRTLINNVLRGLRQFGLIIPDATTSTSDDYLLLVLQFINEAKEEIEELDWPWYALRQTVTINVTAGKSDYILTIAEDADVDTNDRSKLLYEVVETFGGHGTGGREGFRNSDFSLPQIFNVTSTNEYRLREYTQEKIERIHLTDDNETGQPTEFAMFQSSDSLRMKVYPTPDQAYTLKARIYIPQAPLVATSLGDTLTIRERMVWTSALFKANEERGSELGRPGTSLKKAADDALGSAMADEMTDEDRTVKLLG